MSRRNALQRLTWCSPEQLDTIARNVGFDTAEFPTDADSAARGQLLYDWSRSVRGTGLLTLEAAIPWSVEPEMSRQFEVQSTSGSATTSSTSSTQGAVKPATTSSPAPSFSSPSSASSTTNRPKPMIWDATPTKANLDIVTPPAAKAPAPEVTPAPVAPPAAAAAPTSDRVATWMQEAPTSVAVPAPAAPIAPFAAAQPAPTPSSTPAPKPMGFNSADSIMPTGSSSWSPSTGRSTVAQPGMEETEKVSRPETPHGLPAYGERADEVALEAENNPEPQQTKSEAEHGGWWRKLLGK